MWLEAILAKEDLTAVAAQLFPLTFELGADGASLMVASPLDLALVPNVGLRLVCPAELTWRVLGVLVPVKLRSVSFVLSPKVEQTDGVDLLIFEPILEHADFVMVPEIVDCRLTDLIGAELEKHRSDLAWRFAETLQTTFRLPEALLPRRVLAIGSHGAMVRVTEEVIVLAVSMQANISDDASLADEAEEAVSRPVPTVDPLPAPPPDAARSEAIGLRAVGLAVGAFALVAVGLGYVLGRRRR